MSSWRERPEGGNLFWLVLIRWLILKVGRGFAQVAMVPTTLYFFLVRGAERRASRVWLARIGAPRRGTLGVLIHIYTFAMTIVDRVLLLAGRDAELDVRAEGIEELTSALREGHGCLLLGSHLGSFEAIRVFSRQAPPECRHLRVVMDQQQNSLVTHLLEEVNPEIRNTVIDARLPGTQIVLEASEVMAKGGMVAMLADRIFRNETAIEVPFVGGWARLPVAPLAIASALQAPVFMVFGLYEGKRRYRLIFERLERPGSLSTNRREKRAQLNQSVACYAQRLEYYARLYPYNWFNFYDFWIPDRSADDQSDRGERPGHA
ncbi:MAG: lipid A biosynthesis acyltransferase [Wenzhouxiangella sp.]